MRERERERSGQIDSIWWNVQTQFRILVYVKRQVRATVNLDYHAKHQLITRETQCSILHPWIFFILRRKLAAYFTLESSSHSLMHLFYQLHLNDCFTTNVHIMMSGLKPLELPTFYSYVYNFRIYIFPEHKLQIAVKCCFLKEGKWREFMQLVGLATSICKPVPAENAPQKNHPCKVLNTGKGVEYWWEVWEALCWVGGLTRSPCWKLKEACNPARDSSADNIWLSSEGLDCSLSSKFDEFIPDAQSWGFFMKMSTCSACTDNWRAMNCIKVHEWQNSELAFPLVLRI